MQNNQVMSKESGQRIMRFVLVGLGVVGGALWAMATYLLVKAI